MYGAWGSATASLDGVLLQLRALDWDTDGTRKNARTPRLLCPRSGPFKNHPQITVYHGNGDQETVSSSTAPRCPPASQRARDQGYSWANIGWSGWIGSITGLSENKVRSLQDRVCLTFYARWACQRSACPTPTRTSVRRGCFASAAA
jgi:isopenicillin-N N-acyltransferase-like protein